MTLGERRALAIVGAGPSATSLLERLAASAAALLDGHELDVHLIDPHPPGAGRVWRYEQSALLWMNSMAEDVTMFTDDTVLCEGPVVPGPSLADWAAQVGDGTLDGSVDHSISEAILVEASGTDGMSFPTRQLQSAYLAWVYDRAVASFPPGVTVTWHTGEVTNLTRDGESRDRLVLADGSCVVADVVVLALGHLDVAPGGDDATNAAFARAHGLVHVPPAYTADLDLSAIEPGTDVIVRGLGLAFVDLMVLLTEGRGGRFEPDGLGGLTYLPSGREPRLLAGSRRGVPYHAKIGYRLPGRPAPLPRFFDRAAIEELVGRPHALDFHADVWPLLIKDVAWSAYHELFASHPERTTMPWDAFDHRFAEHAWGSPAMVALVDEAVPDPADRFDVAGLDRPLAGFRAADGDELQDVVRAHVTADLARRADAGFSADLGAFRGLLIGFGQLAQVVASGRLGARSQLDDVAGWWFGFFSSYASGPPPARLQQLLALSRAGIVRFLGPGMWVETDAARGVFCAGGSSTAEIVSARALVEARLPALDVRRMVDPLVASLRDRGELVGQVLADVDGAPLPTGKILVDRQLRLVTSSGKADPRRFALGAPTSRPAAGTFARPRTNAAAFRQHDALARRLLALLTTLPGDAVCEPSPDRRGA